MLLLLSADFFQNQLFKKIPSGSLSVCQTVLIWVQTVCEGYQQMTEVVASKERVKLYCFILFLSESCLH